MKSKEYLEKTIKIISGDRHKDYGDKTINHQNIASIREIIKEFSNTGKIHLGGVPMIADDMIEFIKSDLINFGVGVFLFIVITLIVVFREIRWVTIPLLNCFYAVLIMIGVLGFVNWDVTVISSNFISLMLILTIAMNVHLAVRYKQLCSEMPNSTQSEIVFLTTRKMVWPCLYTALTTICAFTSLVFSGIKPVIDFGWMMTIGLSVTFLTSFILFPSILLLLEKKEGSFCKFFQTLFSKFDSHQGSIIQFDGKNLCECAAICEFP